MLQWNSNFGCGSSFVHVCVQDAPRCVERNAPSVLIHTRLLCAQNRFRSTLVDGIVFPICSNLLSLYVHICSRSTPIDQNASSVCSNVLSLDARRSKCVSYELKGALARRLSIQMCLALGRRTWVRKWLDPDVDRKVSK